ncbi:hypothetical protein [Phenylobacterium immobile]|uniref:hypothetical protein n=1 Tax=Phenylobacterium immobile TaxID=21 RepID=UPI001FE14482|nr:hypothetical protein [Phenylobacterium immobile]
MFRKTALILIALAGLVGCAPTLGPPPPPPMGTAEFSTEDFSWSAVPGPNSIVGRLAPRSVSYTCHGASVLLTPETPWSRRRMVALYGSADRSALPADEVRARTPSAPAGDYSAFIRRATCEGDRFSFAGLPDGVWFVITLAKPVTPGAGPNLALMRRVMTRGGRIATSEL